MSNSIVIVEDEKLTADRLEKLISEITSYEVIAKLNSVKAAIKWFQSHPLPEIIFLDIHLGDGSGFDILDSIDGMPNIIFTTAYDQYTLEAFRYNSIDYLLKPIKPAELNKAITKYTKLRENAQTTLNLDKARSAIDQKYKSRFLFKAGSKYQHVSVDHISYFYSHDGLNYARCTSGEFYITDSTMDELELVLEPTCFFRVNRGMIINESHIKEIHSFFNGRLLLDLDPSYEFGDVLVSREKVRAFKIWLDA